jgi:hypothetical protein
MPYSDDKVGVLAQHKPTAANLEDAYTVPAGKDSVVSSLVVCNQSGSSDSFRISIAVGGAANVSKQYIYYDIAIPAYETFIATVGFSLNDGDVIRVYSTNGNCSFNFFGSKVTV